jgi:uncharacterized protein (DUF427 family)
MTSPDTPRIAIRPAAARWRAKFAGHVIADSNDATILEEPGHAPVVYFPRQDVSMEYMSRTARTTHCPYKGEAAYYTLLMDGDFAENAVWTYEDPLPGAEPIAGRLAFYPNMVEVYPVSDAEVNPQAHREDVDEVVRHTDAGDGTTQAPHWPAP